MSRKSLQSVMGDSLTQRIEISGYLFLPWNHTLTYPAQSIHFASDILQSIHSLSILCAGI